MPVATPPVSVMANQAINGILGFASFPPRRTRPSFENVMIATRMVLPMTTYW